MKIFTLCGFLILLVPAISLAETHPKVQAALDYQLPGNTCGTKPKSFESSGEAIGKPVQESTSPLLKHSIHFLLHLKTDCFISESFLMQFTQGLI